MKNYFPVILVIVLALGFVGLVFANSTSTGATGTGVQLINPLGKNTTFADIAKRIIDFLFTIAIPLTAILVLVGGFQMITAGGNPEKFSRGKKTILYAVIGFAVVLLANGVVSLIENLLGVGSGTTSSGTTSSGTTSSGTTGNVACLGLYSSKADCIAQVGDPAYCDAICN